MVKISCAMNGHSLLRMLTGGNASSQLLRTACLFERLNHELSFDRRSEGPGQAITWRHGSERQSISHGAALELIASQHGVRDWNTLSALASRPNAAPLAALTVGARVSGRYLNQPFTGKILRF